MDFAGVKKAGVSSNFATIHELAQEGQEQRVWTTGTLLSENS
jgi:hypothetical protein